MKKSDFHHDGYVPNYSRKPWSCHWRWPSWTWYESFSDKPTLAEELGFDELNRQLSMGSRFFDELDADLTPVWVGDGEYQKFYIKEEDRFANNEWVTYNPHQLWADGKQSYFIDKDSTRFPAGKSLRMGNGIIFPSRITISSRVLAIQILNWKRKHPTPLR